QRAVADVDRSSARQQSVGVAEAGGQLEVVTRGAHRGGHGDVVQADLERFLDHDAVGGSARQRRSVEPLDHQSLDPLARHGAHQRQRVARWENSSSRSMMPNARSGTTSTIRWLRTNASISACTAGSSQYFARYAATAVSMSSASATGSTARPLPST